MSIRSNNIKRYIRALSTVIIITVAWEIASRNGFVRQSILPPPSRILDTFSYMISSGEIFQHIRVSMFRVIKGFIIGTLLALIVGILCGLYTKVDDYLSLIISFLRPIPVLAWTPLLILWLGIGEASKVGLIFIGTFWVVLLNVVAGIKSTDSNLLEVAHILEKDKRTLLFKVILPSALPSLFTGMRAGIDVAWRSVVGAEMIAASQGVGFLINYARDISQPDTMIVGMISIGLVGIGIERVFKALENYSLKWNKQSEKV